MTWTGGMKGMAVTLWNLTRTNVEVCYRRQSAVNWVWGAALGEQPVSRLNTCQLCRMWEPWIIPSSLLRPHKKLCFTYRKNIDRLVRVEVPSTGQVQRGPWKWSEIWSIPPMKTVWESWCCFTQREEGETSLQPSHNYRGFIWKTEKDILPGPIVTEQEVN